MDYDDFSKDDLIGATQVNLYEVLHTSTHEICIRRLLDDKSVSLSWTSVVVARATNLYYSSTELWRLILGDNLSKVTLETA